MESARSTKRGESAVLGFVFSMWHFHGANSPMCGAASANCRLELNYGSQEEISMMPLMMQKDYKAK